MGAVFTGESNAATTLTLKIEGAIANLASPNPGGRIDIGTLNRRRFLEVTFPGAPAGESIIETSITDLAPEFTLGGPGLGTASLDISQAPVLKAGTTDTYYYWIVGDFGTGAVSAAFLASSWTVTAYHWSCS